MALNKPFCRIARPKAIIPFYVCDPRYANDKMQLSRMYLSIERALVTVFNYIEPAEENKDVYSSELYTILLRACTEVELNCKLIMETNGATPQRNNFTINDYKKLEISSKLSKYTVELQNWKKRNENTQSYEKKIIKPFINFAEGKSPQWYQDYNAVKHNREQNFHKATLENCISAVAAILVLLYSQFGALCITDLRRAGIRSLKTFDYDFYFDAETIFDIEPPQISDWTDDELYIFDWDIVAKDPDPFAKFEFNTI